MKNTKILALLPLALLAGSCVSYGPEVLGLAPTQDGQGPRVRWDLAARPLPEIPFPNDAATFPDNDSPTGRRVNASMVGPTDFESHVRRQIDTLDGFGTYAPITVSFDQALDLDVVHDAMAGDDAFGDDVLYVVSLDKKSPRYGKPVILDVGNGNFPVTLSKTTFFPNDERAGQSNLVFETVDENVVGDTNHDGRHDVPNVLHPGDDTDRNMMTFYEKATNTLIVRPLLPLDEQTTYAVILTRRIRGRFGEAIRSPFDYVNDVSQTHTLKPLVDDGILTNLGLTLDDVAFTWAFTTQTTTKDLIAIRSGLEGYGPFASLAGKYPTMLAGIDPVKDNASSIGSIYVLDGALLRALLRDHFLDIFGGTQAELDAILLNYQFVDYLVAGTYDTPNFIDPHDGVFHVNTKTGEYRVGHDTVTFTMAIPRQTATHKAPFPMQVHLHGYTSSRLELILWAGTFCRFGGATLTIYAFGPYVLRDSGSAAWDDRKADFQKRVHDMFGAYCDNFTPENIVGVEFHTPSDMARYSPTFQHGDAGGIGKFFYQIGGHRPTPELAQYAVPGAAGLYLAGTFMHPPGGVTGGGRATAVKICGDLGIDFDSLCEPVA